MRPRARRARGPTCPRGSRSRAWSSCLCPTGPLGTRAVEVAAARPAGTALEQRVTGPSRRCSPSAPFYSPCSRSRRGNVPQARVQRGRARKGGAARSARAASTRRDSLSPLLRGRHRARRFNPSTGSLPDTRGAQPCCVGSGAGIRKPAESAMGALMPTLRTCLPLAPLNLQATCHVRSLQPCVLDKPLPLTGRGCTGPSRATCGGGVLWHPTPRAVLVTTRGASRLLRPHAIARRCGPATLRGRLGLTTSRVWLARRLCASRFRDCAHASTGPIFLIFLLLLAAHPGE